MINLPVGATRGLDSVTTLLMRSSHQIIEKRLLAFQQIFQWAQSQLEMSKDIL